MLTGVFCCSRRTANEHWLFAGMIPSSHQGIAAMSTVADTLKEIHRLRRHIKNLQAKLDEMPQKLRYNQEGVTYHENKLRDNQDAIKRLRLQAKEDEIALGTTAEQIKKYEGQLSGIISKKEFDALQHEIAHARKKITELEDRGLTTLTEIDERLSRVAELEKNIEQARADLSRFEQESAQRRQSLSEELERANQQLTEAEAHLPPGDFQDRYQRLLRQKGEDTFAAVKKRTCQACFTEVTAQMHNELASGNLVFCKSCGRIIYLGDPG
jgi:predicted  nucleic acid-binding Zn-ribbon protein